MIFYAEKDNPAHGFEISLGVHYTQLWDTGGDFSSSTGMPDPGTGAAAVINAVLHWEIATIAIDIMAFTNGLPAGPGDRRGQGYWRLV